MVMNPYRRIQQLLDTHSYEALAQLLEEALDADASSGPELSQAIKVAKVLCDGADAAATDSSADAADRAVRRLLIIARYPGACSDANWPSSNATSA